MVPKIKRHTQKECCHKNEDYNLKAFDILLSSHWEYECAVKSDFWQLRGQKRGQPSIIMKRPPETQS